MASSTLSAFASLPSFSYSFKHQQATSISSLRSVSIPINGKSFFPSLRSGVSRLQISCAAKPETVDKVCEIVRKQLALSADSAVSGESKFAALGADSLDTVEIVMGLEEEFGSVLKRKVHRALQLSKMQQISLRSSLKKSELKIEQHRVVLAKDL